MKNKFFVLLVLICVFTLFENFSFRLPAQLIPPIHFTKYTTDDGLPHDIGYQMQQDEAGYLWIGTDNGLARFDGYQFKTFGDEAGLTNPFPIDLAVVNETELLIGSWGNGIFKKTKDSIFHVPIDGCPSKISRLNISNSRSLQIWTKDGLVKLGYPTYSLRNFDLEENKLSRVLTFIENGKYYNAIATKIINRGNSPQDTAAYNTSLGGHILGIITPNIKTSNHQEIILTDKGAFILDPQSPLIPSDQVDIHYPSYPNKIFTLKDKKKLVPLNKQLEGIVITSLVEAENGDLWLGGRGKIYHLAINGDLKIYPIPTPKLSPFELKIWQDQFLVFYSTEDRRKLFLFEMQKGQIHELSRELELSTTVSDIYVDKQDNFWVTTDGSGLYCLSPYLTRNYGKTAGFENSFIYDLEETKDGTLFAATKAGVYYFKHENWIKIDGPLTNVNLRSGLEINKQGHLWFGGGINLRNLIELKIPSLESSQILGQQIGRNFYLDTKDRIWSLEILSFFSQKYQDNQLETLKEFYKKEAWGDGFSKKFLNDFFNIQDISHDQFVAFEETENEMLIGTSRGLFSINGNSFHHFSKKNGLPSTVVNDIVQSEDGRIWIATEKGICIKEGEQFLPIPIEGLASVQCRKLLFDHKGQLWVGTPYGLHYFVPTEEIWIPITKSMGLIANDVISLFEDSKKQLWIGTSSGLSMLKNDIAPKRLPAPGISVERILINNQPFQSLKTETKIPFRSTVRIDYTAFSFQAAKDLWFEYRLNTSEDWQPTQSRTVTLSDLADGTYQFQIRAKKPNSNWSKPTSFAFSVLAPWFRSLWFLLFAGLGLLVIGRFLILRKIRSERKTIEAEAQIKEEFAHLEMKALQAQMNPHFIFNALNSIMDFVMNEDKYAANQYLAKFARLMRLFLDSSNSNYISLGEELDLIKLYVELEKLRFKDKFDFIISYEEELPIEVLEIPSMLIQPFIENAIHHGLYLKKDKGVLTLRIDLVKNQLKIQIEDDGVGREAALAAKMQSLKSYKSRGTQIVQEKIDLLNTRQDEHFSVTTFDLKNAANRPVGTKVCIDITIQE